jgi:Heparinase II/III-like protein/Heparinase II/III N-terminus
MLRWLRGAFGTWRKLGVRRGTAAAIALALAPVRSRLRARWLRARPLQMSEAHVREALGGVDPVAVLRGTVLQAMPTVAAFERSLHELEKDARSGLLEVAEQIAAHRFDLLGSGPTNLGPEIDWATDFKSGRRWPLQHISRLPVSYPDNSDIKVPWELSRFQHLPVLAAAHRLTGEQRWLEEIGAQLRSWTETNPVEFGPNWACTMEVAIRAANWIAALSLVAEAAADQPWMQAVLASLLLHGRFIRSHLEWAPARGNHYLSDIVGLLHVAALFSRGPEGREWAGFAARELTAELSHQIRPDGCDHEASIPYHRLVAELFICGLQAAEVLVPETVGADSGSRVQQMLGFTTAYTRGDGLAPQVGDADDGRYLPLGDYARSDPRSHLHLFSQADRRYEPARGHAMFPHGGYWVMRGGGLYLLIRCGDVGVGGIGSHAHNDALAFELACGMQPLVIDPGSFLYTSDPLERNRFRSTAFHSTLQLDGAEQNAISLDSLFTMDDRRRATALKWNPDPERPSFLGRHYGFDALPDPATQTRRIELDVASGVVQIADTIASRASHEVRWTFPLAPCEVQASGSQAEALFPNGTRVELDAPGVELHVEEGWLSPSYGRRLPTPFLRGLKRSQPVEDTTELSLRVIRP